MTNSSSASQNAAPSIEDLFREISDSEAFRTAPAARNLLVYLWNQRGQSISEYALGLEALGKPAHFDPKSDASVRVAVARLRGKLKEFYEAENCSLRLSIPRGGHEMQWKLQQSPAEAPAGSASTASTRMLRFGVALAVAGAIALATGLYFYTRPAAVAANAATAPLARFWRSFISGGKPVMIVVPSPLYFVWPKSRIYVRDLTISKFPDWPNSPFLREVAGKWGPPELSQTYVGAVEMLAATRLVQHLERAGQPVEMVDSSRFAADSFATHNTISLGMPRTAGYLDRLMERTNFYLAGVNPDRVVNRHPTPGEPAEFRELRHSPEHAVHPGLIIALPTRPEGTRSLLLIGQYSNGVTPMLISVEGLARLEELWKKAGSPEGWEMVVQAEIYRETALKVWPVAFRPISSDFWK